MSVSDKKKFIILQEDDKGFSFKGKKPSGYTKIEDRDSKFKIFYYIQNINCEETYYLNLILKKDSKIEIISIGEASSDENGKIDVSYDFDDSILENVCGSSISIKDLKGDLKFPLSGFLPKKKLHDWKVNQFRLVKNRSFRKEAIFSERKRDYEVREVENEKLNSEDEIILRDDVKDEEINSDFQDFENENSEVNEYESKNVYVLSEENSNEEFRDEDYEDSYDYEEYEEIVKGIVDTSKDQENQVKYHADALKKLLKKDPINAKKIIKGLFPNLFKDSRNVVGDYEYRFFLNILEEFEEIDSIDFNEYRIFRVNVDGFSQMENMQKHDNVKYTVVYYPMISMYPYFKERGYFLIGIKFHDNISNLLYGVEALEGDEKNFPYDGETGFNKYVYDYGTSKGYHIMEYDYKKCFVK